MPTLSPLKIPLGVSVLEAARQRIAQMLDECPRALVSFSGGKDSTVMLHLVMEAARARHRRVAVLFIDLEAQYQLTIDSVSALYAEYADAIDPYWLALPLSLRNAVSHYQPQWQCWDPDARADWVRTPPKMAITDGSRFPWFRRGMEFEELTVEFAEWYADGIPTACFIGIRSDESLHRWRTLRQPNKRRWRHRSWTTMITDHAINVYPIYDWRTADIWTYLGKYGRSYNRLYDRMHQAGLTLHQMRICQPYGDDQRKGLWLYHLIEPQTWGRVVARVNNANGGALYAQQTGNILGVGKIALPPGHTWESFAAMLLESLPPSTADHFREKFRIFRSWWAHRGYTRIPDSADPKLEAAKKAPSWRRICKVLLRYDYWCKGLSFGQTASSSRDRARWAQRGAKKRTARATQRERQGLPPEEHTWTK